MIPFEKSHKTGTNMTQNCHKNDTASSIPKAQKPWYAQPSPEQVHYVQLMDRLRFQWLGGGGVLGQWLRAQFGPLRADWAMACYDVGTLPDGRTVFPYVSLEGFTTDGKVMRYNADGHRCREGGANVTWLHAMEGLTPCVPLCLFGEELLKGAPYAPVGLVESEKTAIVATLWNDRCVWLATGGKGNFRANALSVLSGRTVLLYPDADALGEWMAEAHRLGPELGITFQLPAAYIRRISTPEARNAKWDLADLIIGS